jgi:hypothetical protein
LPSQALREWDRAPTGLLEDIIEARAYARAKAIYTQNPMAEGELVQLVKVIEFELAQKEIDGE